MEADVIDIASMRFEPEPAADVRPIPPALLERLRALRGTQQALIEGCVAGFGIDLSRYNVDFNLDTGVLTTSAR